MDSLIISIFIFFLGASMASFLQMYLDTGGKNLWRGINNGSSCDGCGTKLNWFYLVPVFGSLFIYIFNSGKTKCCGQSLSWKYIFGEVILGLWFVSCGLWFGFENVFNLQFGLVQIQFMLSVILGCIFFMLVMQDLEDMSVSAKYLWILCALAVLGPLSKGADAVAAADFLPILIFSPFWLIYFLGKVFNKPMIGEADPYVFTALGVFSGTQFSISLFLYSVWLGAFIGVGYLYFINKKFQRNVRIPFLPIIFLACLIILITNFHIIKIQDILFVNEVLFST